MTTHEYSVIPAPRRGVKGKGVKGSEAQFANALTQVMNQAAAEGWEYLRAETLPAEERQGLTGKTTVYHNMLVFRRPLKTDEPEAAADPAPAKVEPPAPEPVAEDPPKTVEAPKAVEVPKVAEPVFTRSEINTPRVPTEYTVKVDPEPKTD